ncbi:hypothetical protein BD779DRAFT_1497043 [Infundibulicybe gibba]|nr:hypothetical protein BD779DRAFT_1497043 [Infundibulicybe gibba]
MDEFPPPPPYTKFSLPSCERLIKGSEFYTGVRIPTTPILEPLTSGPAVRPATQQSPRKLFPIYTLMPTGAVDVLHFWENDPAPNCPGVALVEVYAGRRCIGAPDRPCVPSAHRPNKIQLLIEVFSALSCCQQRH